MRRVNRYLILLGGLLMVALAARIALPFYVKDYVNSRLAALNGYTGSVEDVHIALWRGAYRIDGLRIVRRNGQQQTPFFSSDHVNLSVEWRSLFKGQVVAEGEFQGPNLNLVKAENEQQSQLGKEVNWAERLEDLFPFRFNTVAVHDGTVTFRAPGIQTQDALVARTIEGSVSNLTNVVEKNKDAFADFKVTAEVLKGGVARTSGSVDPLAGSATFDVNLAVEKVHLPQVNPWLRQYIKADAASGDFELYMEVAAADGRFKGYAKPLMQNVDLHGSEDENKPALKKFWEGTVNFAAKLLENRQKDQVAARIPFSGTVENPKASILETIVSVLHNAFVGAFANSLEDSISIHTVKKDAEKSLQPYALSDDEEKSKRSGSDAAKHAVEQKDGQKKAPVIRGPRDHSPSPTG